MLDLEIPYNDTHITAVRNFFIHFSIAQQCVYWTTLWWGKYTQSSVQKIRTRLSHAQRIIFFRPKTDVLYIAVDDGYSFDFMNKFLSFFRASFLSSLIFMLIKLQCGTFSVLFISVEIVIVLAYSAILWTRAKLFIAHFFLFQLCV